MFPMPSWAADLIRGSHIQFGMIRARRNGSVLALPGDGSLVVVDRTILPLTGGEVAIDGATGGARRTLSCTFAPWPGLFDLLAPTGVELIPYTVLQSPMGDRLFIQQGVFPIDSVRMGYAANGDIQVSNTPDRWSMVRNARFVVPRASGSGMLVRRQIALLLQEAIPGEVTVTDLSTTQATVPAQTWDRDRDKAIEDMAEAASLDVFFDRYGQPVIRDAPRLSNAPVWLVDASASGVLIDADRERNRQKTFNLVVVTSSKNDGTAPFDPVFVWDNDPTSPTYAGPDPINRPDLAGPFGVRPTFLSSPLIRDTAQAQVAGQTTLDRVRGLAAQLDLTTVPHPGLEDGDVLTVQLPQERYDMPRPIETHLIDTVTIPLAPSKGNPQKIGTRSTRPDTVSDS